jgi:hypothetical protein
MVPHSRHRRARIVALAIALAPVAVALGQANSPPGAAAPGGASVTNADKVPRTDSGLLATPKSEGLGTESLAEMKIRHVLEDKTECDFTETPLADVVDYFKNHHHIEIQLDLKALQDEAIDSSVPVTRSLKSINLKSALRLVLSPLNLTYIIRDDVLLITSRTEADADTPTRIYQVHDLLTHWPAGSLDLQTLILMISSLVQPDSWDDVGGPLTQIQPLPGALAIRQSQAVQENIASFLALLRRTRNAQILEQTHRDRQAARREGKPSMMPMRVAAYRVSSVDSAGLRASIESLIAPKSWKENGGEGEIQIVRCAADKVAGKNADESRATSAQPNPPAPTGGGFGNSRAYAQPCPDGDLFIVRQTDDIHQAIEELLMDVNRRMGPWGL